MQSVAHKRLFGVEIECGMPGGFEQAGSLFGFGRDRYGYVEHVNAEEFTLGSDGSGVELRTPPLRGKRGFNKLRSTMEKLKANGAYVTRADGMHVHHDAPEFVNDADLCLLLVKSWKNNEAQIHNMVAPRRRTSQACPTWRDTEVVGLDNFVKGVVTQYTTYNGGFYYGSRKDLNLTSLEDHGTIEIRLHEGTLDPDVAIAWIMFGQRFIHSVLKRYKSKTKRPITRSRDEESLMRRIQLSPEARFALEQKRAQGYLTTGTAWRGTQV